MFEVGFDGKQFAWLCVWWWWWWRSWEIECFRQKAKRSGVLERSRAFEKEREVDWGWNNVCKGSQEDLLALLRGPALSFSGGGMCVSPLTSTTGYDLAKTLDSSF